MAQLTHDEYEKLERAIIDRGRIAIVRRGMEYVVRPERLRVERGRELLEATHPTTGDVVTFYLDDVDAIQPIR